MPSVVFGTPGKHHVCRVPEIMPTAKVGTLGNLGVSGSASSNLSSPATASSKLRATISNPCMSSISGSHPPLSSRNVTARADQARRRETRLSCSAQILPNHVAQLGRRPRAGSSSRERIYRLRHPSAQYTHNRIAPAQVIQCNNLSLSSKTGSQYIYCISLES